MRNKFLSLIISVGLVSVYSAGALVATPSPAAAQDRVQLQVFMMKLPTGRGKQTKHTPITVYIDTDHPKDSRYVCAIAPRIINSVFSRLRRMKLRLDKDGLLDMGRITETLRPVVKRAVKRDIVRGVEARQRTPKVSAAGARLFTRTGCIGVGEEDE
ncbi:MAG: hypothetical protein HN632_01855 [Rhodospirillaceae bacterium]|nr:hypothetical protein [Rhodospirillaceae bacterium]MBT7568663.1 hypothetical protein [Rhodospirillaceae bacterium]